MFFQLKKKKALELSTMHTILPLLRQGEQPSPQGNSYCLRTLSWSLWTGCLWFFPLFINSFYKYMFIYSQKVRRREQARWVSWEGIRVGGQGGLKGLKLK